jgi:hypothetical protein
MGKEGRGRGCDGGHGDTLEEEGGATVELPLREREGDDEVGVGRREGDGGGGKARGVG